MPGITWLASYPKSGNTWLRMFLACYRNKGQPVHPNAMPAEIEAQDTAPEHYHSVSPCPVADLTETEGLFLRGAVLLKLMTDNRLRPLFVKTHNARVVFEDTRLIPDVFTSPSIYIVRDPRDVVVSFADWSKISIDKAIGMMANDKTIMRNKAANVRCIFHYVGDWSAHVASWDRPDTLAIRYEDMHTEPFLTFGGVLRHVGIDVDQQQLAGAIAASQFDKMRAAEDGERFHEAAPGGGRFFRVGKAGGWHDALTTEQAARIEADHGETMKKMGYLDAASRLSGLLR